MKAREVFYELEQFWNRVTSYPPAKYP